MRTPGYTAATEDAAVFDRSDRGAFWISGRAPEQMLTGITSGRIPEAPERVGVGLFLGTAAYSTILTPKGRIVTDLRLLRIPGEEAYLMDLPPEGTGAALEHLRKVLPPRFAKLDEADRALLTVVGPIAVDVVAQALDTSRDALVALEEDQALWLDPGSRTSATVVRTGEVGMSAFDVWVPASEREAVLERFREAGAVTAAAQDWETLRIEAGRPRFGVDMSEETIPIEAGIEDRAIDHAKGCYTGQEVIVRIQHRGHVNRHLRGLLLEDGPLPAVGVELYATDPSKPVGWITSAVDSPAFGRPIALGYVRREVEPGSEVSVGSTEGPAAQVRALTPGIWRAP